MCAAAAKLLHSCPTLCDPIDGSPPGSPMPGILQARTLEWVAISFSSAWKWKVKVKSLGHVQLLATPWTAAHQAPPPMGFSRQEYWSGVPLPSPGHRIQRSVIVRVNWVWATTKYCYWKVKFVFSLFFPVLKILRESNLCHQDDLIMELCQTWWLAHGTLNKWAGESEELLTTLFSLRLLMSGNEHVALNLPSDPAETALNFKKNACLSLPIWFS